LHSKLTVLICAAWTLALPLVAADTGWKVTPVAGMLNPTSLTVPPTQTNIRPYSVAVDRNDQVYFWDEQCYIRRITPTGLVNVAGNGQCGDSGDDGPATSASIAPRGQMAFDTAGTLYFIDIYANRIRRISPAGTISSFSAPYYYFREPPIAVDMAGNVWSRNAQGMVLKFSPAGEPTEIAEVDPVFDGGIAVEGSGTVFVASAGGLFQVNASGVVTKLWGQTFVSAIAANPSGGIAFAENEIYELAPNGVVSLKAGGRQGYDGENGQAGGAAFDQISGLAYDSKGVLYVADWKNARIRSVSTNGVVRTVAGGAWSDNAPATSAELRRPNQLARDISGAIYVLDRFQVRRIGTDGIIRNYAGNGLSAPHTEGVVATKSSLDEPAAITCDAAGNLYIFTASGIVRVSSSGILQQYSRLRSWSWSAGIVAGPDGVIYVAGIEGIYKVTEGDSWKQIASFRSSTGLAIDAQGNLYGADNYLHRIRPNGAVERLSDELVHPASLALDAAGNIYFTSLSVTGDVTKFDPTTGQFTKLVMEGGIIMDPGRGFEYTRPGGILVEPDGGLLIANSGRHRIERFTVANCRFSLSTYSVFLNPVTGIEPIDVFTDGWCEFNVEVFRPYWLLSDYIRVRGPVTITPFIPSVNRPTPPGRRHACHRRTSRFRQRHLGHQHHLHTNRQRSCQWNDWHCPQCRGSEVGGPNQSKLGAGFPVIRRSERDSHVYRLPQLQQRRPNCAGSQRRASDRDQSGRIDPHCKSTLRPAALLQLLRTASVRCGTRLPGPVARESGPDIALRQFLPFARVR
jgi:sugar lactone lactonase YvrE